MFPVPFYDPTVLTYVPLSTEVQLKTQKRNTSTVYCTYQTERTIQRQFVYVVPSTGPTAAGDVDRAGDEDRAEDDEVPDDDVCDDGTYGDDAED